MYQCVHTHTYILSNNRERGNLIIKATIVNARTIDCVLTFNLREKTGFIDNITIIRPIGKLLNLVIIQIFQTKI
jgi:hypothetical protein